MADRGRKFKVNEEKYLKAVKRKRSVSDRILGEHLGVARLTVYRYRTNNPQVYEKALKIISGFEAVRFDPKNITFEMFKEIPVIAEWVEMQEDKRVGIIKRERRVRSIYNVCKHLNIHPDSLTLEECSILVKDARKAYENETKWIRGLAYLTIRKPIRSFFQLIRGISGELLTAKGIDAGRTKGTGSHSKQKVTQEQRAKVIKMMPVAVKEVLGLKRFSHLSPDLVCEEMIGITYFMYYTATRIGSVQSLNQGTLSVRMNNDKHVLRGDEWTINLMDKGKKGGLEWDKMLIDDGLEKIKNYICKKFDISLENIEVEMKEIDSYLFPVLNNNYDCERRIMKLALSLSGVTTKIPNHIWRHTFAQDFLSSTDWNYELCASIGGWKDTGTLKLSYGEMSDDAKRRGLRKAMGLPVEDVTYELRF